MATIYRKSLHNKLIDDFKNLTFPDDTNTIFTDVTKIIKDFPVMLPYCVIAPTTPNVEVQGLSANDRILGYTATVYEEIEASEDLTDAESRIDRLEDIEDMIIAYLEQIPNPIERVVTNVHAYKIDILPSRYTYSVGEAGVRIYLEIDFNVYCNVNVT